VGALKLHVKQDEASVQGALGLYVGFRKRCAGAYHYGFNGQEKVDEIAGVGNHNTVSSFGREEYDTRLGRRWSLDPKTVTGWSGYATFMDCPTLVTDIFGDSGIVPFRAPIDPCVGERFYNSEGAFEYSASHGGTWNRMIENVFVEGKAPKKKIESAPASLIIPPSPNLSLATGACMPVNDPFTSLAPGIIRNIVIGTPITLTSIYSNMIGRNVTSTSSYLFKARLGSGFSDAATQLYSGGLDNFNIIGSASAFAFIHPLGSAAPGEILNLSYASLTKKEDAKPVFSNPTDKNVMARILINTAGNMFGDAMSNTIRKGYLELGLQRTIGRETIGQQFGDVPASIISDKVK
jgi:hypothetical protein